jgi:hypothetical protein
VTTGVRSLEARITDDLASELAYLASVWADLLLVDMSLHERKKMTSSGQMFARRALWEQAVVACGRCFKSGRRRQYPAELLEGISAERRAIHEEVLRWRDKHVAHRVLDEMEWARISLEYPYAAQKPEVVKVRIETPMGPDDESTVGAFAEHAKALRDRLWKARFPDLQSRILEKYASDDEARSKATAVTNPFRKGRYGVTINP